MKLKDIRIELDKYDDDYELTQGDKTIFEFESDDDDKTVNMVAIA